MIKDKVPLILLVEDSEDDILLTLRALRKLNVLNRVETVQDGAEALQFLAGEAEYAHRNKRELPELILLDINLPRMNGLEVLSALKSDPVTRTIPVIMLTTSEQEQDMTTAYERGANSYIRKPVESEAFEQALNHLGLYWLAVNTPPPSQSR